MGDVITVINAKDVPQQDFREIPWICKFEGDEKNVSNYYSVHWNMPSPRKEDTGDVGHPPHMHRENEIMMLIGTDPSDHSDLGAEVELCVGENMEKHVFTESCTIIIPGGTPHGNFRIVETRRPWIFVQIQEAARRTEKFLWHYLTDEQISNMEHPEHWQDVGF